MRVASRAVIAVVAAVLGFAPHAAGAAPAAHAVGVARWQTGSGPIGGDAWVGPFTFDGAFGDGSQLVVGQVEGGVGRFRFPESLPSYFGPFRLASVNPGAVNGRCTAAILADPVTVNGGGGLFSLLGEEVQLSCEVRIGGGRKVALNFSLLGVITGQTLTPGSRVLTTSYAGIFVG